MTTSSDVANVDVDSTLAGDESAGPEPAASAKASPIEVGDEFTTITFRGQKFSFPTSRGKWRTKAMQAFQDRRNADGVEQLLGPQQWDLFDAVAPSIEDFWEFFVIFAEAAGFVTADRI